MDFYEDIGIYGDEPALILPGGTPTTYADLLRDADVLGSQFPTRCLAFILCENNVESIAGYIGCLRARVVPLLLKSNINAELLAGLVAKYRPQFIWLPRQGGAAAVRGREAYAHGGYTLLATPYPADYAMHGDLALLLSTSGSTGSPMLVRQSYRNITSNANAVADSLAITGSSKPITTLPMSYTYGLSILNSHLLRGAAIVLSDKTLMEKAFWRELRASEATTFSGVPYVYEMLKKLRFERMDLPSLKVLTQAGGRLDPGLAGEFAAICQQKGIRFYVMYGQVEATARISCLPSEYALSKVGSIGKAIPGGEIWLEDENGNVIAESDVVGELVYRGDNVTMGYASSYEDLGRGDENGGVLRTGDLARRDVDGFFYIAGRKKRFLKLFGNRVNLDEVEQLVRKLGYECVCSGVDDHLRIYTTDQGHHAAIRAHIAERTGLHASGFEVMHIERVPRNDAGKILYSALPLPG